MKSLSFFYELLFNTLHDICDSHQGRSSDLTRDIDYVSRRIFSEGLKFLTVSLPFLGKAVIKSLETGLFELPAGFKPICRKSRLPAFLQGSFKRIFSDDGCILVEPDPFAIQEVIQLTMMFYKLELPYTETTSQKVIDKFLTTEDDLKQLDLSRAPSDVVSTAQDLLRHFFRGFDPKDILPRHGPGSVASGEKLNDKWSFKTHYHFIHQKYSYYDYFLSSRKEEVLDRVSWYRTLRRAISGTTKVVLVPKDSRGPRLISSEPLEYMYLQQGLGDKIAKRCENHFLTKGFVNFTDQSINGAAALESSLTRRFATLDLEEASDRVSLQLVRLLFPKEIADHLEALRSTHTRLPNGDVIALEKFAPMGSALCFPVLALTLYAICKACVRLHGTGDDTVLVYGDDILVPSDLADTLNDLLPAFGLRVNQQKSFSRGFFRESCGTDAYKGVRVNPLRVRKPWTSSPTDSGAFASYWELSQALFERGFWKTSKYLQDAVERVYGRVPYGTSTSGYPCRAAEPPQAERLNLSSRRLRRRWNTDLQRWEFRVRVFDSPRVISPINEWPRLLKGLVSPSLSDPTVGVVPRTTKIRTRWMPV
jgi:hypothetical protein